MAALSLINEGGECFVRMAHLACVGSQAINGVAALHTELLKLDVLTDFRKFMPEKFSNQTNEVTPRRWIALANPRLDSLIERNLGEGRLMGLSRLRELEPLAEDADFRAEWRDIKRANKARYADQVRRVTGIAPDPDTQFDVQVKPIHEYKRQHLSLGDGSLFQPLVDNLMHHDPYMLFADFQSYMDCQTSVDQAYMDVEHWTRMSILNTARSGKFSSDRSIKEYCDEIRRVKPVPISSDISPVQSRSFAA